MTQDLALVVSVPQEMQSCVDTIINCIRHLSFADYFYCPALLVANISLLPHLWGLRGSYYIGGEQKILRQKELDLPVLCSHSAAVLPPGLVSSLAHSSFCFHPRSLSIHCQFLSMKGKAGISENAQQIIDFLSPSAYF